jgi:hypothetical protein
MPCQYLVESKENGHRPKLVECGRDSKYFAARGAVGEMRAWLCWKHARYCETVLQWELRQIAPPDEPQQSTPVSPVEREREEC